MKSITEPSDNEDSALSLDTVFNPPTKEQWVEVAVAGLSSSKDQTISMEQVRRTTLEGIPIEVLYDAADACVHLPRQASSSASWDNRVSIRIPGAADATDPNSLILAALAGGATSIELHTASAQALEPALRNVKLDIAPISLRCGTQFQACATELIRLAGAQGIAQNQLKNTFNADPLGALLEHGVTDSSIVEQLQEMASFVAASSAVRPQSAHVLVDTSIHHNAGASTVEELHGAIATGALYLETLLSSGMSVNDAYRQIVFQVAMDADVLLGVAKLRALRTLWWHVAQAMDNTISADQTVQIVSETSRRYLSKAESWNNHLRNLTAASAAMFGGADTLIVHPHDTLERGNRTTDNELGDRMARNVAIILERESGLSHVHDPMAGSYAVENLTQQLAQHTWQSLSSTDTAEGWLDELTSGRWQTRLSQTHKLRTELMQQEKKVAVGVNRFVDDKAPQKTSNDNTSAANQGLLTPVRDAQTFENGTTVGEAK